MRNTRQGPHGSKGSDAPVLQQVMDAMRALQEANKEHRREHDWIQERIKEEARAEQERLRAESSAE